jgi:hypothetical protein
LQLNQCESDKKHSVKNLKAIVAQKKSAVEKLKTIFISAAHALSRKNFSPSSAKNVNAARVVQWSST